MPETEPREANIVNAEAQAPEAGADSAASQTRRMLDQIKGLIQRWLERRLRGSSDEPSREDKIRVATIIKDEMKKENANGEMIVNQLIASRARNMPLAGELITYSQGIIGVVQAYHDAWRAGFFEPIADVQTRSFHDGLMTQIDTQGVSTENAPFYQRIISGMLRDSTYVRLAPVGSDQPTQFEHDLMRSQAKPEVYSQLYSMLISLAQSGGMGDITPEMIQTRIADYRRILEERQRQAQAQEAAQVATQERQQKAKDPYEEGDKARVRNFLIGDETQDAKDALELFDNMESVPQFYEFYKKKFAEALTKIPAENGGNEIKRRERAAKMVTNDFQRQLLFFTHRIYEQVIGGNTHLSFQESVRKASGSFGSNPDTNFTTMKSRIVRLWAGITARSEYDNGDVPFFQYGNERKEVFQQDTSPDSSHKLKKGKVIMQDTVGNELKEVNFKDFAQSFFTSIEAERDLLEAGINANHLILTGKVGQNATFFNTLAGYAQDSLPANRIDELYKLPYSEIVEAAKIQLSSFYKMKYALNNWRKEPHILADLFDNVNDVEKHALLDMIDSYKKEDVPEWVIRRAIIHARMHLALINTELHAISSYAHAPVSDLGSATYRDPSLKNLDTFRSWYGAEQWQVADTHVQYMAYMPSAAGPWMYKDWNWQDVTKEGKEIGEQALQYGDMARVDRKYFNQEVAPNILELNPMGFGGVEIQGGWRLKYPAISWVYDMIDHLGDEEHLKMKDEHTLTNAWKRYENIGINILKMYENNYLFGKDNELLKLDEKIGTVKGQAQFENFFKFLYRRYFSHGVGHDGLSFSYKDEKLQDKSFTYKEFKNADQFWDEMVKPLLTRKKIVGMTETEKDADARNQRERADALHGIIQQALGIATFERLPMDFVSMENPSRSQNGVTLLSEIQHEYITADAIKQRDKNHDQFQELNHAFNDLLFVQQQARVRSIKQMSRFVEKQTDQLNVVQKNVFCEDLNLINQKDYSDIQLVDGVNQKGYVITADIVRGILMDKYHLNPPDVDRLSPAQIVENQEKVEKAVKVYNSIKVKVIDKPKEHEEEINPTHSITDTRIKMAMQMEKLDPDDPEAKKEFKALYAKRLKEKYQEYRNNVMMTRLAWSQNELLSGQTALPINDTAYQFLDHTRAGQDMVSRSITAIANTQERYKNDIMGGELNSALKKAYRKDDTETWQKIIVELRNSIKQEDGNIANDMALKVAMNVMNVMRINSDAENPLVEADYVIQHRKRAAISNVAKEGEEHPWHRQDRYQMLGELLHNGQFEKRAKTENQVYTPMKDRAEAYRYWFGKWGALGEMVGGAMDKIYGKPTGLLVRQKWLEHSGEGLRERMIASMGDILMYEWQGILTLVLLGLFVLSIKEAYEDANE